MVKRLQIRSALSEGLNIFCGIFLVMCQLILTILLVPIFLCRWILNKISFIFNSSLGEMVHCRDNFFASENFTSGKPSRAVIVVCATLEGHVSLKDAQVLLLHNLLQAREVDTDKYKHPKLRQYVTTWPSIFGFRFWKWERNFRISKHVLQFQPSEIFTETQLHTWIETLLNEPFEDKRSPWKVFITNNYVNPEKSGGNMTIVTVKAHHCLSDGYGLLNTVIETVGTGMSVVQPTPNSMKVSRLNSFISLVTFPIRSFYELSSFSLLLLKSHVWKIPDEKKSWKQIYAKTPTIQVEKIKAIKNKFGVSFTSVVLSAYAGAARKSLERNKEKVGEYTPCAMILPLPDHPKFLQNHCTGAYISLPTMACSSVERLMECEWQVNKAKRSVLPFLGRFFPMIGGSFPTSMTRHIAKNRHFPIGLSNFPVANGKEKLSLFNRNMLDMTMGAGAQAGTAGLNFFVYAYDAGIQFTVTAEAALMSREELKYMTQSIVDEIESLYSVNEV